MKLTMVMKPQRMLMKVRKVVRETADAVSFYFDDPGQEVTYKPGQFLTLTAEIGGRRVSRAYSLSTSPHVDSELAVTVKRVPQGIMSNYLLDSVRVGDHLEVSGPNGSFTTEFDPAQSRNLILFGGGSGITPLISLARSALRQEPKTQVTLIYANRNLESVIFKEQLCAMQKQAGGRFWVIHVLEILEHLPLQEMRQGVQFLTGRLHPDLIEEIMNHFPYYRKPHYQVYVCGPEEMMALVRKTLQEIGLPDVNFHQESFTAPLEESPGKPAMEGYQQVKLIMGGRVHEVRVPSGKTILQAALEAGIPLPYSCQGALCGTCQGTLISGQVKLDKNYVLTDEDLESGQVLMCVGRPLTHDVVVEIG